MKQISKKIALLCVIITILAMLCSCRPSDFTEYFDTTFMYNTSFILGKNSNEIQEKYGEFDKVMPHAGFSTNLSECKNDEGLYINCTAAYFTGEGHTDLSIISILFFPTFDEYYLIYFDSDGIAYKVDKHHSFLDAAL
jgi:hypothetical protein